MGASFFAGEPKLYQQEPAYHVNYMCEPAVRFCSRKDVWTIT